MQKCQNGGNPSEKSFFYCFLSKKKKKRKIVNIKFLLKVKFKVQDIATVVLNLKLFALSVSDDTRWRNHLCKRPTYFSELCLP